MYLVREPHAESPRAPRSRGLVVGLGHEGHADDGAGPVVARLVASRLPEGWTAIEHRGDLSKLLDLCAGMGGVVIVDAVVTGAPVGTVHHLCPDERPERYIATVGATRGIGLLEAIAIGRVLGRLPDRVTLVGLEARLTALGAPMSLEVQANLPMAAALVLEDARHAAWS